MKAKKIILLFYFLNLHVLYAGIVCQTLISITEQKVLGHTFKHIMTSGNADNDEYFIDGHVVSKIKYEQQLEQFEQQERQSEYVRSQAARRSRLDFSMVAQLQIITKLLHTIESDMHQLLARVQNPNFEKFFVFTDKSISSSEQLAQLQNFVDQLDDSINAKIAEQDLQGLYQLHTKLEHWPDRLEKFLQDTIQQAIKKSDDTAMLKELLKLVS